MTLLQYYDIFIYIGYIITLIYINFNEFMEYSQLYIVFSIIIAILIALNNENIANPFGATILFNLIIATINGLLNYKNGERNINNITSI